MEGGRTERVSGKREEEMIWWREEGSKTIGEGRKGWRKENVSGERKEGKRMSQWREKETRQWKEEVMSQ